ncbi:hypothetical protein K8I28_02390 [bacterium]|nr:hypothetical protein [bacterium]
MLNHAKRVLDLRKAGQGIRVATTQITTQKIPLNILAIFRENPKISRMQIASKLTEITEDGIKYHIDKLKASGQIRHIGPSKGGRWEVLSDLKK